jgi:hypothetical protein
LKERTRKERKGEREKELVRVIEKERGRDEIERESLGKYFG